jgi:hypothetical protein
MELASLHLARAPRGVSGMAQNLLHSLHSIGWYLQSKIDLKNSGGHAVVPGARGDHEDSQQDGEEGRGPSSYRQAFKNHSCALPPGPESICDGNERKLGGRPVPLWAPLKSDAYFMFGAESEAGGLLECLWYFQVLTNWFFLLGGSGAWSRRCRQECCGPYSVPYPRSPPALRLPKKGPGVSRVYCTKWNTVLFG